jgi:predicted NAD-dependent protein-ADP-ribosyltransferase YbiA (DUF1768 family)
MSVLQFYSKSKDIAPGKGSGETLGEDDDFTLLSKIVDWRKMLSNFWEESFFLDGFEWLSVEHYYHAMKTDDKCIRYTFTLDSNTHMSKSALAAKKAGGMKFMTQKPDFHLMREDVMVRAQKAKFEQNDYLGHALLVTWDAQLNHFSRGSPPISFDGLMDIRDHIIS